MQKFIARLFVVLFSISLFVPILPSKAYDITVDQQNTTISQAAVVIYNYGHNQTFTPTKDVLTSVQVYLKDRRAGSNITLTVKDETAGQTVLQVNQRMGDGTGWEVFNFTGGDPLGYILTPGNLHSIWIETAYYTSEPIPKWVRTSNDVYSGGTRRQNSTAYSDDDFPFATFGYSLAQEEEGEKPVIVPTPGEGIDTPTPPDQTDTETAAEDLVVTENEEENATDAATEEDTTISLTMVEIADIPYFPPVEEILGANLSDDMIITGTATASSILEISINDTTFEVVVDSEGAWIFSPNLANLAQNTTLEVTAKYKNSEKENSFFSFIISDDSNPIVADDEKTGTGTLTQVILLVFASLLAFFILFGFAYLVAKDEMKEMYIKYFRKNKNGSKKPAVSNPSAS